MTVSVRAASLPCPEPFGKGEGIALRQPIALEEVTGIEAGIERFAILVFRDHRTDPQQITIRRKFGKLEHAMYGIRAILSPCRLFHFSLCTLRTNLKRLPQGAERTRQARTRQCGSEVEDISDFDHCNHVPARTDPGCLVRLGRCGSSSSISQHCDEWRADVRHPHGHR